MSKRKDLKSRKEEKGLMEKDGVKRESVRNEGWEDKRHERRVIEGRE